MTDDRRPKRNDGLTPTPRDEGCTGDLGVAEIAATEQIAGRFWPEAGTVYFPAIDLAKADPLKKGGRRDKDHTLARTSSPSSCERRMRRLKAAKLLVRRSHRTQCGRTSIWMLSKSAFRREARDMGRPDDTYPGWPKSRIQHYLDTNDVYFLLAGELDAILEGTCHGPNPVWEWRNERRSYERYTPSWESAPRYHQPDAEILFLGRLYILERQTERSKEPPKVIAKKVQDHNARAEYLGVKESTQILFACDTPADTNNALRAAENSDLPLVAASVAEVASHLTDEALKLS
jgi:hypothetical protein